MIKFRLEVEADTILDKETSQTTHKIIIAEIEEEP